MSEKRFELTVNQHNQCDIVDWVESRKKNAICVYNDLGDYYFSSAKALCELLNELHEKNKELEIKNDLLSDELEQAKAVIHKKWTEYLKKKELSK